MLAKRIIPCLDIKNNRVVKGVNFVNLVDAGDPCEIAKRYEEEGADELVYLDITATSDKKEIFYDLIKRTASKVFMPLTIGGGIKHIEDIKNILRSGADKVSINSTALLNPKIIKEGSKLVGKQCIVVAIDVKKVENSWHVFINGGRIDTKMDAILWAKKVESLGAGEVLLTSMDKDGTKDGYDIELINEISKNTNIPIIASGGAGKKEDFLEVFEKTSATGALAASVFHFEEIKIKDLKCFLKKSNIEVRYEY